MLIDPTLYAWKPNDPEEYVVVLLDNAANLHTEEGASTRALAIERMSKYLNEFRIQTKYILVLIQHQAQAQEGLENRKFNLTKPTVDGLGDCKTTPRDASCTIGLYSPFKFKEKTYENYDIEKLRDYCRFLEILEDRDYGSNGKICPLFFDGAVSMFKELPKADDLEGLNRYYDYINRLEAERSLRTPELSIS